MNPSLLSDFVSEPFPSQHEAATSLSLLALPQAQRRTVPLTSENDND